MAYEPLYYDNTETGAPTLNNAAGALLSVLQAVLVDGFNIKSVTSIVVAGNVATVTCTGHNFQGGPGKPVLIAGASPSGLNGNKLITVVNANTFTFPTTGISDQSATGTITAKRPGMGWTRQYTGTNKAVYKSSDPSSTGRLLRIDDTAAGTDARARMYESMTDVDTGTGPAPTDTQQNGGTYWSKGPNDATAKTWAIVGDEKFFYLLTQIGFGGSTLKYVQGFGDIITYRASDAFCCTIAGGTGALGSNGNGSTGLGGSLSSVGTLPTVAGSWLNRVSLQTGTAVRYGLAGIMQQGNNTFASASQPAWPSPVDNGVVIARPIFVTEENSIYTHPIRGELPGMVQMLGNLPYNDRDILDTIEGFGSTKILVLGIQNGSSPGRAAFDITGPWRS